jgi:hypothetical protein
LWGIGKIRPITRGFVVADPVSTKRIRWPVNFRISAMITPLRALRNHGSDGSVEGDPDLVDSLVHLFPFRIGILILWFAQVDSAMTSGPER